MPSTSKYSGDAAIWATGILLVTSPPAFAVASAEMDVSATAPLGSEDAASAATDGWVFTAWSSAGAPRLVDDCDQLPCRSSARRDPRVAAAQAPRRKIAAQIRRSADAPTWTAMRACRARSGRASLVTSPRIVSHQFEASGLQRRREPEEHRRDNGPGDQEYQHPPIRIGSTAEVHLSELWRQHGRRRIERTLQKQPGDDKTARAAASASRRLSVRSCRMMRRRDAPSERRMPTSRWRETPRASSRLATLAQPIIRINPKAKNSGEKTHQCLDAIGQKGPLLGVRLMNAGRRLSVLRSVRPDAQARARPSPPAGDIPGFSRPTTSMAISSSRPV